MVRRHQIEIGDGVRLIKRIRNTEEGYNVKALSNVLLSIKKKNPNKKDATILMEPDIEYDALVRLMDAIGTAEVVQGLSVQKVVLFPEISIGDAPAGKGRKG